MNPKNHLSDLQRSRLICAIIAIASTHRQVRRAQSLVTAFAATELRAKNIQF